MKESGRLILWIIISTTLFACKPEGSPTVFDEIFEQGSPLLRSIVKDKDKFEIQILFSPVVRTKDSVYVKDHFFNYRPGEYFYPASTVKMPVAFMALQKLEELRAAGIEINRDTPLKIDSIRPLHIPVHYDSTNDGKQPTLARCVEKVFSVSDNDAYNRLYEFCGSDYINAGLRAKGIFTNGRVVHRLGVSGYSYEENKITPPIHFLTDDGEIIYSNINPPSQGYHLTLVDKEQKGKAYIDEDGNRIEGPFDFREKNFININDLQESLKRMILPELYYPQQTYNINEDDRNFVLETMQKLPGEYEQLSDETEVYYDSYAKFFLFGDSKKAIPDHIKIRNKVGLAYGYVTDCAYIQDTKEGIEYFLTATILANKNQTFNDGIYEYDEVGIPFLAELGRLAHAYMIKNK